MVSSIDSCSFHFLAWLWPLSTAARLSEKQVTVCHEWQLKLRWTWSDFPSYKWHINLPFDLFSILLHSALTGIRLCWVNWRSSALWFWTVTITRLMSSSPTWPASPHCASTRTRSTICPCLWRRFAGNSQTLSEGGVVSADDLYRSFVFKCMQP